MAIRYLNLYGYFKYILKIEKTEELLSISNNKFLPVNTINLGDLIARSYRNSLILRNITKNVLY